MIKIDIEKKIQGIETNWNIKHIKKLVINNELYGLFLDDYSKTTSKKSPLNEDFDLKIYSLFKAKEIGVFKFFKDEDVVAELKSNSNFSKLNENQKTYFSDMMISNSSKYRKKGLSKELVKEGINELKKRHATHLVRFRNPMGLNYMMPQFERLGYQRIFLIKKTSSTSIFMYKQF